MNDARPAALPPPARPSRLPPLLTAVALLVCLAALAGCAGPDGTLTRMEVRFNGEATDFTADVRSHLDSRPAQAQYDRDGIPHPDAYTAHDQIEEWSQQSRKTYATTSYPDSGFGAGYFLTGIDGVSADGVSAYWSLSINGEPATVGMSEAVVRAGDTVTWTYTSASAAANDPDPIGVTVDPPPPTQGETTTVTGSVNHEARISIDGGPSIDAKPGRWNLSSPPLAYGQTQAKLRVDDGVHSLAFDVTFVRLAAATFEAVYTASPGHDATSDAVWYDPGVLSSASMYEGTEVERSPQFTVHDLMVAWTTQTGTPVEYGSSSAFGFSVDRIDGIGQPLDSSLPPYWCYTLNGNSAELGISLQTVQPGDVVTWEYGTCA